jgi:DNA repair protein RadC
MSINDWPELERPREKLLAKGAPSLSDAELLAIFLRTGIQGKSAVDLARELLDRYGSLRALLEEDASGFCSNKGLGQAKFAQLQAVLEMANRHLQERLRRGDAFTDPLGARQFLQRQLRHRPAQPARRHQRHRQWHVHQ